MKKGIIVILAILITVGAGITVPIMMRSGPEDPIKDKTGEATAEIKTPISVSTDSAMGNNELITPSVPTDMKYKSDVSLGNSTPTVVPKVTARNNAGYSPEPNGADNTAIKPTPTAKENSQSESWVERKIQEHRDEIDDDDLEDFRRIYSSVDIGYIQGLTSDGLSAEETEELKAYLKRTLGGDYERAKELFYEYSYLLSEV
jgi:hypothetical protein